MSYVASYKRLLDGFDQGAANATTSLFEIAPSTMGISLDEALMPVGEAIQKDSIVFPTIDSRRHKIVLSTKVTKLDKDQCLDTPMAQYVTNRKLPLLMAQMQLTYPEGTKPLSRKTFLGEVFASRADKQWEAVLSGDRLVANTRPAYTRFWDAAHDHFKEMSTDVPPQPVGSIALWASLQDAMLSPTPPQFDAYSQWLLAELPASDAYVL